MRRTRRFSALLLVAGLGLATPLLVAPIASARPGGGQTFRSSSSSSSSSSSRSSSSSWGSSSSSSSWSSSSPSSSSYSSGGGASGPSGSGWAVTLLLGLALLGFDIVRKKMQESERGWESGLAEALPGSKKRTKKKMREAAFSYESQRKAEEKRRKRYTSVMAALEGIRSKDDDFSLVLFEDFLYSLYAEVQTARGKGTLDALRPYLAEGAIGAYSPHPAAEVRDVVVGSMTFAEIIGQEEPARRIEVLVAFEVNYTEVSKEGREQSYWVVEKWRLVRDADVKSRPPDKTQVFGCPSCGAPQEKAVGSKCPYCGVVASPGALDWTVLAISIEAREPRGPMLTGTTEEVGTDLPTIAAPDVQRRYKELKAKDPALAFSNLQARVEAIFRAFHEGWSSQDLSRARPFLSDHLFQSQRYWVETYQKQKLRNITEDARIVSMQIARIVSDKHYDAITVRVFATCLDYTVDASGKVVGGSKTDERAYSEYWTLIRGAERRGAPRTDPVCPNCGAPNAEINMAGTCGHCKVHVTSGEFDWVLSRIEQDEVYQG